MLAFGGSLYLVWQQGGQKANSVNDLHSLSPYTNKVKYINKELT